MNNHFKPAASASPQPVPFEQESVRRGRPHLALTINGGGAELGILWSLRQQTADHPPLTEPTMAGRGEMGHFLGLLQHWLQEDIEDS